MKRLLAALVVICACAASFSYAAESYPSKPVRFTVPFPPGGGTDGLARILGAKLAEFWGQQVIIDNRGGAQGNIGTSVGAKAAPDGYTITLGHQGALTINPHLYSNPGYDALRDFAGDQGHRDGFHPRRASFAARENDERARDAREAQSRQAHLRFDFSRTSDGG